MCAVRMWSCSWRVYSVRHANILTAYSTVLLFTVGLGARDYENEIDATPAARDREGVERSPVRVPYGRG